VTTNKADIIKAVNEFTNTPIAPLKKENLMEVTGGAGTFDGLMQYEAMLDNITIGAHTNKVINYAGIDWTLRLLTAEEYVNIRIDVEKATIEAKIFSDYYIAFLTMKKVLARALTPNPFKIEGKGIFTEDDLRHVNFDVLEGLYIQYIEFVTMATRKPTEYSDEEIQAAFEICVKKPEASTGYERPRLQAILLYALNCYKLQAKMLKSDMNN